MAESKDEMIKFFEEGRNIVKEVNGDKFLMKRERAQ